MTAVEIRRAVPGEAATLSAIARASKAHWGYDAGLLELWEPQLTVSEQLIRRQPVWTAVLLGRIVGFYAFGTDDDVWELEHLWVHPSSIGRGVGRALFEHAVGEARAAGATAVRVVSDPHAEAFYLHMGASRVGEYDSLPAGRRLPVLSLTLVQPPSPQKTYPADDGVPRRRSGGAG